MLKAVVDTNILISGILKTSSTCKRIIHKLIDKKFDLVVSPKILEEYIGVINRPKFHNIIAVETAVKIAEILKHRASIVKPSQSFKVVQDDPDDNRFIEAAVEAKADLIVSGDNHLLCLKTFKNIPIIPAGKFLKLLR